MKIVIKKEEIQRANKLEYSNPSKCPLAKIMQKILENPDIFVFITEIRTKEGIIGYISPGFLWQDLDALLIGEIDEFITEYTSIW